MKISVSFLKSKENLATTLQKINESLADYIHVDLMDGVFVKEQTQNEEIINELKKQTKPLDVHLMMKEEAITKILPSIIELKPAFITIPCELKNKEPFIKQIKEHTKCGLAINPDTNLNELEPFKKDIDLILVMSVYPGKGGQSFLEETIKRLEILYQDKQTILEVDGGINEETIKKVKCDIAVSGSFICMSDDYNEKIKILKEK